jgi:hypothetical protein
MTGSEQAPTRAAVLELKEEQLVVREAYDFLDEKRLLLAGELLRQLERYERLMEEIRVLSARAGDRLAAAVQLHGLQGLSVYPAARLAGAGIRAARRTAGCACVGGRGAAHSRQSVNRGRTMPGRLSAAPAAERGAGGHIGKPVSPAG